MTQLGVSLDRWNPLVQYYAAKGWAVFAINYRGSSGYGRQYRDALMGNWGVHDVDDTVDALDFLSGQKYVNKRQGRHNCPHL